MLTALLLAGLAHAGDWEWRSMAGAQIDPSTHGVFDLVARNDAFSASLLTDTLDIRWAPDVDGGRWWVAARGEAGIAMLLAFPWTDGAPDPTRGLNASYGGIEGGRLWYLPRGFYAGGQLTARYYTFAAMADTVIAAPDARPVATPELLLGYWQESVQGWMRAGANVGPEVLSPHVMMEITARPADWTVAPRAELRAGLAMNQDYLTTTRLGGLTPYVVPLAGAGWAEFWVEDYAAGRLGPDGQIPLGSSTLTLGAVADLVVFREPEADWETGAGFAGLTRWDKSRWFVEGTLGVAPWLERADGVSSMAGWVLVGFGFP